MLFSEGRFSRMVGIHFVMPDRAEYSGWDELTESVHNNWPRFVRSEWAWIVQTYYELCSAGYAVTASSWPESQKVNVMHADDYLHLLNKQSFFVAVVVADRRVYFPGNCNLVQNKNQRFRKSDYWIPHWDQPGLIPRVPGAPDPSRAFNVAFAGIPENSVKLTQIVERGAFEKPVRIFMLSPQSWNDFSEVDVLVAVRDFKGNRHPEKPPTKLFNAWVAGVPFIGGMDSAYEQVGQPGVDYLQVSNQKQLLEAISRLQNNDEWSSLVNAGRQASQAYNRLKTRETWSNVLFGRVQDQFQVWERSSRESRLFFSFVSFLRFNRMRLHRRYLMLRRRY